MYCTSENINNSVCWEGGGIFLIEIAEEVIIIYNTTVQGVRGQPCNNEILRLCIEIKISQ